MAFDFKKEYREFYLPPKKPGIIDVPEMRYVAVRGEGDPNDPEGEYKVAMGLLYGIAFTIKMSYKGSHKIEVDFHDPSAGFCHRGGLCLGSPGSRGKERQGLFKGRVLFLPGGALRPVHACGRI